MPNENTNDQRLMAIMAMMAYYDDAQYSGKDGRYQDYGQLQKYKNISSTSDVVYESMRAVAPHFKEVVSRDQYNSIMAGQTIVDSVNANGAQLFAVRSSSGRVTIAIAGTNGIDDWVGVNLGIIGGIAVVNPTPLQSVGDPMFGGSSLQLARSIQANTQAYLNTVVSFFQRVQADNPGAEYTSRAIPLVGTSPSF